MNYETVTRDLNIHLYQTNRFGCASDEYTIELAWNAHAFHSIESNREGLLVYK